jgi:hypothetical protein
MSGHGRLAAVVSCALILAVGAALPAPSLAGAALHPSVLGSAVGYAVVPWANVTARVLDSRLAWLPPLIGFTGAGLLLSDDPFAASPAVVATMSSPAPNGGIAEYDYGRGGTRNLTFPWSMSGASWPGDVTPFSRNGKTYLLTLSHLGTGVSGSIVYREKDLQIVGAGILDYPSFTRFLPVNLSVPLTSLGYTSNETVGIDFGVVSDGANITAVVAVSLLSGSGFFPARSPPWAKYVYSADLAHAVWTEGQPFVLAPRATIPWSSPVTPGFLMLLTPSELMIVTAGDGASELRNVQFYDLARGRWTNASLPGRYVLWHGRIGGNLYLLEDNWRNSSNDEYVLNRVDLDASGAATGVSVVWDKVFPRPTTQYATVPVVTGGRLDVFLGVNGHPGYASPTLTAVYSYDLVCGTPLSVTNVSLTVPLLNGFLQSANYPSLHGVGLFNGFLADVDRTLVYPLDLVSLRDAVAAYRNATPCASCAYAVYVTNDAFPHLDLLLEEQYAPNVFGSSPVTNLTAVELTANATLPTPLPSAPESCGPATTGPGGSGAVVADVAIVGFVVAGLLAIVATLFVLLGRVPRRPGT